MVSHGLALPLTLMLVPTPGREQSLVTLVVVLLSLVFVEVLLGPLVSGLLARSAERRAGGPGSRRTLLEGMVAGLAWVVLTGLLLRELGG